MQPCREVVPVTRAALQARWMLKQVQDDG